MNGEDREMVNRLIAVAEAQARATATLVKIEESIDSRLAKAEERDEERDRLLEKIAGHLEAIGTDAKQGRASAVADLKQFVSGNDKWIRLAVGVLSPLTALLAAALAVWAALRR